ncbi:ShlB/FhaC/HecB family hemolysin secretion/activation protein [Aquitalea aquatica]|uniref:ShlB/FhaC/HecB family hemolysin secretion/activation protein n=1 Tax=Aquitalea aquatica TaxID=3044273 RepID=A0A838Y8D9_9NEIS|nr:ShlB/FhaC/HecB family hemolysin secretion/activation protein [Aquitalea magnusonii]MBA4707285.1 ShlB/FhaC/HecB family hemolysin secretion/activation protein [Aquitalea magnusonii]
MQMQSLKTSVSLVLLSLSAYSQNIHAASDIDAANRQAEIIQQRQQQQLQQDREDARRAIQPGGVDLKTLTPSQPAITTPASQCHDIQRIVIRNSPHMTVAIQKQIDAQFAGHCLGVGEISQILGLITRDYIEQGYVTTRAYLPAQDLRGGTLLIDVVEGVIEQFKVDDNGARSVPLATSFPHLQGKLLNLRDLEQGIDQINRLQSNNAKLDIQPGGTPGGSTVVIHNEASRPLHLFVTYDNQGSTSTGGNQAAATLTLDNLLGLGEMFAVTHRESIPTSNKEHYSASDDFNLSLPYGYNTFAVDVNRSRYINVLTLPSGNQETAEGNNKISTFSWNRVAFRDQVSRLSFGAALTTKDARNYFADQYLNVSSRKLSVLDLKASYSTAIRNSHLSLDLDYARGLAEFGAMHDSGILPGEQPHAQFQKLTADLHFHLPFDLLSKHFSYDSEVFAQQAYNALYGSEQLLIGSIYSVRGFVNNSLSGDTGYYWRNDLSMQQQFQIGHETLNGKIYAALDTGWVTNMNPDLQGGSLTGAAIGLQAQWRGLTWDLFRSAPVEKPATMSREPAQTWFRVSVAL